MTKQSLTLIADTSIDLVISNCVDPRAGMSVAAECCRTAAVPVFDATKGSARKTGHDGCC